MGLSRLDRSIARSLSLLSGDYGGRDYDVLMEFRGALFPLDYILPFIAGGGIRKDSDDLIRESDFESSA